MRTLEDMCVVCDNHDKPSCGFEIHHLQHHCPYNEFIENGYELAKKDLGWHSVEESLPPMGEEVIVLTNEANGHTLPVACHLCFAHRPEPEVAVCYDGWNIPGVKYWMNCPELPEE